VHTSILVLARVMPTGFSHRSRRRFAHAYHPSCARKNSFTCADLRSNNILYLTPKVNNVL
jgi:hypothetical protein